MDDICNGGGDHPKNLVNIERLLGALHASNFKIGAGKIELGASFLLAFGFRLSGGTWAPDPERTAPIAKLVPPANRSQLRGFLGLAGYYRMFIRNFAGIAKPLSQLLKEDQAWCWGLPQDHAFQELKEHL